MTEGPTSTELPTIVPTFLTIVPPILSSPAAVGLRPTPTVCARRTGWVPYIIQQGDTLFSISRRVGVTVSELQQANCIEDPDNIRYGQVISVPPGQIEASSASVIGCNNPAARITAPRSGASLRGVMTVTGTATLPNFSFYKLEVRPDEGSTWNNFAQSDKQVSDGVLGTLNTGLFAPGNYWIQLTVVDRTGNIPILPCAVRVRFVR